MRYLPLTDADRTSMLEAVGVTSIADLFGDVPDDVRLGKHLDLPIHKGELEVERHLAALADKNVSAGSSAFFVGAGAYRHHVPASVDHLIQRSEFLTSYTPYQPEISQGTLQSLFEFQTQVALITGMEVANASMYDGSTACAEAVLMAHRITKRKKAILAGGLHGQYADVTETLSKYSGYKCIQLPRSVCDEGIENIELDDQISCVVVQNPNVFGQALDVSRLAERVHEAGALLVVVVTEPLSLGLLRSPGDMGADIVVGEGQSLGVGLNFGGPYLGLFATRQKYVRQMPGRLCGETVDADGRRGFVLTLSTREQHIRREKATSNICTNSGLCCLAWTIHMSLLGEKGFTGLAALNHEAALKLSRRLARIDGVELLTPTYFNEFSIRLPRPASEVVDELADRGVLAGVPASRLFDEPDLENVLIVAATETNTDEQFDLYEAELRKAIQC